MENAHSTSHLSGNSQQYVDTQQKKAEEEQPEKQGKGKKESGEKNDVESSVNPQEPDKLVKDAQRMKKVASSGILNPINYGFQKKNARITNFYSYAKSKNLLKMPSQSQSQMLIKNTSENIDNQCQVKPPTANSGSVAEPDKKVEMMTTEKKDPKLKTEDSLPNAVF